MNIEFNSTPDIQLDLLTWGFLPGRVDVGLKTDIDDTQSSRSNTPVIWGVRAEYQYNISRSLEAVYSLKNSQKLASSQKSCFNIVKNTAI